MSSFDPTSVRKAVADFTPRRPQKFQDLLPAKEVIIELRSKRASYRAIAELLTQHCLPVSKTAIAVFCHQVLGEVVRPRRRPGRKRLASTPTNAEPTIPETNWAPAVGGLAESIEKPNGNETEPVRSRGPRIAQVRLVKPQSP